MGEINSNGMVIDILNQGEHGLSTIYYGTLLSWPSGVAVIKYILRILGLFLERFFALFLRNIADLR